MVGLKYRTFVAIIEQAFFTVGLLVLCGLAYLLDNWRLLTTVISIPSFIFAASYFLFIPESPRWLISAGRLEEADKIIKRMARINKKEIPVEYFSEISAETAPKVKFWKVFTSKKLTCWCAIMCFCWISVSVVYFGLALNSQDLGGNVFVNFSLGAMVEFPAYFFCIIFLDRMGRKKLQSLTMVVGGVSCLATVLPILLGNSSYQWLVLLFAMIGKLGITSAFGAVYLFGCELFPTVLRNSAMGLFSTCGRIGAVVAPYIAELGYVIGGSLGRSIPLFMFGGMALIAAALTFILPETRGRKLPDTIKEAENVTENMKKSESLILKSAPI